MTTFRVPWAALLLALSACPSPSPDDEPPAGDQVVPEADLAPVPPDLAPAPDLGVVLRDLRSQDVTILYPVPPGRDVDRMVWGSTYSSYGRLVPQTLFARLPMPLDPRPGSSTRTTDVAGWSALRLVGVRLDPCFASRGDVPEAMCRSQIRLVLQGVHAAGDDAGADDGAIHVLYELPRAELLLVAREVLALTERQGDYAPAPLGVHPILAREGVTGAFAAGLKQLLMQHLGEDRITHLTFFARVDSLLSAWHFGAFDRQGTGFQRATLVTTTTQEQILFAGLPVVGSLSGSTPTPTQSADSLLLFLNSAQARAADDSARQAAYGAALRIENPLRHTPETIDCLSCHVAMAARISAEDQFGLSSAGHPDLFTAAGDLRLVPRPVASLENIHALSYSGTELGLNQRTVNESAAVAARLTALLRAAEGQ